MPQAVKPIVAGLLVALAATATAEPAEAQQRRERDRITTEELQASAKERANLFQAIRSLRPHFLEGPRGTRSLGGGAVPRVPLVYLNGTRAGDATMLRDLLTVNVAEVRFTPPTEASNLYGLDHGAGVIHVTLINRPPGTSG